MKFRHLPKILPALAITFLASATRAQSAANFSLAPYVDNQTFAAARIDLSAINLIVLQKFCTDALPENASDSAVSKSLTLGRLTADAFLENLKSRGVHTAYFTFSHPDVWPALQPLAIFFPLDPGQDPKPLLEFLHNYEPLLPAKAALLHDNTVFFGQEVPLHRLQSLTPQPRPELITPLDGASPIQIVLAATPDSRRVVSEMMPRLPEIPELPGIGGQSTDFYSKDFINVILSLNLPPTPSLTLAANFSTPAGAAQLSQLLQTAMKFHIKDQGYQDLVRKAPFGHQMDLLTQDITHQLESSPTTAAPTQFSLHFNANQLGTFIQIFAPATERARNQAKAVTSMSNLRQVALAAILYRGDHKNAWPDSLNALAPYTNNKPLTNPRDQRPYILHPWTADQIATLEKTSAASTPIAYEQVDDDNTPIAVAYLDGHVELQKNKKSLTDVLAAAEAALKK